MTNQVWFITGSSRGLGRSVAEEALAAGNKVVATARRTTALDDLADKYEDQLLTVSLDVTDPAQASAAIDQAIERFGRLDVVVNNAGYADIAPVQEVQLAAFRAQVEAVFFGTVYVTKAALPVFRRQGSGYFIQVTSVGGRGTAPGLSAYQSAKFAVEGFSGVLAKEVAPLGIRVTLAEPARCAPTGRARPWTFRSTTPPTSRPWERWPSTCARPPAASRSTRPRSPASSSTSPATRTRRSTSCWGATRLTTSPAECATPRPRARRQRAAGLPCSVCSST